MLDFKDREILKLEEKVYNLENRTIKTLKHIKKSLLRDLRMAEEEIADLEAEIEELREKLSNKNS